MFVYLVDLLGDGKGIKFVILRRGILEFEGISGGLLSVTVVCFKNVGG